MVSNICWFWPQFTVVVCCGCGCGCGCCCGCGCGCGCRRRRRRFKTVQLSEILNKPRWSFREWPPSLQYFTAGCCPNICCNSNCTWMTTTLLVFPQEDVYMRYLCISMFLVTAPLGRPHCCRFPHGHEGGFRGGIGGLGGAINVLVRLGSFYIFSCSHTHTLDSILRCKIFSCTCRHIWCSSLELADAQSCVIRSCLALADTLDATLQDRIWGRSEVTKSSLPIQLWTRELTGDQLKLHLNRYVWIWYWKHCKAGYGLDLLKELGMLSAHEVGQPNHRLLKLIKRSGSEKTSGWITLTSFRKTISQKWQFRYCENMRKPIQVHFERPLPCFFEGSQTWSDCERWKKHGVLQ